MRKPTKEDNEQFLKDNAVMRERMNNIVDKINDAIKSETLDVNPVVACMIDQQVASFFVALCLSHAEPHIRTKLLDHIIKDAKRLIRSIKPELLRGMH